MKPTPARIVWLVTTDVGQIEPRLPKQRAFLDKLADVVKKKKRAKKQEVLLPARIMPALITGVNPNDPDLVDLVAFSVAKESDDAPLGQLVVRHLANCRRRDHDNAEDGTWCWPIVEIEARA